MGGEITWECQGGNYVFQLVFYRDCNGALFNPVSENIDVWNHPTLSSIVVNFVSNTDLSPSCTTVPGGPSELSCGTGANSGNGQGAIEKIIYRSNPISMVGTPPVQGWILTYNTFSRNPSISNLVNPSSLGITITAKIFSNNTTSGCIDNSPQFLQDPYFISCAGDNYSYNSNAIDPDLDSLVYEFGIPLNNITGAAFNPPTNPNELIYNTGFSSSSPTPGVGINPLNIPAQLSPTNGDLTFTSYTTGDFVVKIVVKSYRDGLLISEVMREMQLIVFNCIGTNNKPTIPGPFAGLFETTINAGDLINFNLSSTDVELLQNGAAQSNILTASGQTFASDFVTPGNCANAPCATLTSTPPITMTQGVSTNFNWQTDCSHLIDSQGNSLENVPYNFVFKITDDYCSIPKVSYATITINVKNSGLVNAPKISCIQTNPAGDVVINWVPPADPDGGFVAYNIYSLQNGLLGTIPLLASNSFTDLGAGTLVSDYYIEVVSGCNGNSTRQSDTLKNIALNVLNPLNGTAILQWNNPQNTPSSSMNGYYHIYREYPVGTWSILDSVQYGTTSYIDTIDICSATFNYQINLPNQPCPFLSNIVGDDFEDMMTPAIPIIEDVNIDTNTNLVTIDWNVNSHEDTYGYIIYAMDQNGFFNEIDTVWGRLNTDYTYNPNTSNGSLTYTVAAFDSCFTTSVPATYQTSAKAEIHTTQFLTYNLDLCGQLANLNWNAYVGWASIDHYEIYQSIEGAGWTLVGTTSINNFTASVTASKNYCFTVKAVKGDGVYSFSNITCFYMPIPSQPGINYLETATVVDDQVFLKYFMENNSSISNLILLKSRNGSPFTELTRIAPSGNGFSFIDEEVDVNQFIYSYKVQIVDSCGRPSIVSNEARTILLNVQSDLTAKTNYITWSPYIDFDGPILTYHLYRGIDGNFNSTPMISVPNNTFSFVDDFNNVISEGQICYKIVAEEGTNIYGRNETSTSNIGCMTMDPIIYIPNAFSPDGINKIFKPIVSDFEVASYDLTIFSRWGQTMFKTNLYDEGWDGVITSTNTMAEFGTYLYMLVLRDANGIEIVKRGHVTLLK